jgi:hypothetical protein
MDGRNLHDVGFHHAHIDGVDWLFVDHISYHRHGNPYGNVSGPYEDNLFRFSLLCLATCIAPKLDLPPPNNTKVSLEAKKPSSSALFHSHVPTSYASRLLSNILTPS